MATYWEVDVVELTTVSKTYIVKADSPEEARELAGHGETVEEYPNGTQGGVIERETFDIFEVDNPSPFWE